MTEPEEEDIPESPDVDLAAVLVRHWTGCLSEMDGCVFYWMRVGMEEVLLCCALFLKQTCGKKE